MFAFLSKDLKNEQSIKIKINFTFIFQILLAHNFYHDTIYTFSTGQVGFTFTKTYNVTVVRIKRDSASFGK